MNMPNAREHEVYRYYVILMLLFVLLASCNKKIDHPVQIPPDDKRPILLKQLVSERLPSPYFHFNYTEDGYAGNISYADNFYSYKVTYKNKRVISMLNEPDHSELNYEYNGAFVSSIIEYNPAHRKFRRHKLAYNSNGQLSEIISWLFKSDITDSLRERRVQLQYHADGNLFSKTVYINNLTTSQLELSSSTEYTDYDTEINVDDFYLLQDSWAHLLFLPQVRFQKNNPHVVTIKGSINDYRINYTYDYNDQHRPTSKHARMEQVRGENMGAVLKSATQFSYY